MTVRKKADTSQQELKQRSMGAGQGFGNCALAILGRAGSLW